MKSVKSPLSVFTRAPCRWWHFGMRIKWFCRSLKYGWQRTTKGYCDSDLWNLDHFYSWLFVHSLKDFKRNLHGAPDRFFDRGADNEIARWEDYIDKMISHFWGSIEGNIENEYSEAFSNLPWFDLEETKFLSKEEREKEDDKWKKEIRESYFNREKELSEWRKAEREKALMMLNEVFDDLWD